MSRRLLVALAAVSAVIALPACPEIFNQDDAGADGGSLGTATGTRGDQCTTIYTAFCSHAINDCLIGGSTLNDCVASGVTSCCAGRCTEKAVAADALVSACTQELQAEDCNNVATNATPADCSTVFSEE